MRWWTRPYLRRTCCWRYRAGNNTQFSGHRRSPVPAHFSAAYRPANRPPKLHRGRACRARPILLPRRIVHKRCKHRVVSQLIWRRRRLYHLNFRGTRIAPRQPGCWLSSTTALYQPTPCRSHSARGIYWPDTRCQPRHALSRNPRRSISGNAPYYRGVQIPFRRARNKKYCRNRRWHTQSTPHANQSHRSQSTHSPRQNG